MNSLESGTDGSPSVPGWRIFSVATATLAVVVAIMAVVVWSPWQADPDSAGSVLITDGGQGPAGSVVTERPTEPRSTGVAVTIPAIGLDAPLDPIAFEGSILEPPADVTRGGLWADGATLADDGEWPTVITGHVSDGQDRPGEFKALWQADVGMVATTRDADGTLRVWRVVEVTRYEKDALPREVFLPGEGRELRLITCADREQYASGSFHYSDNLVVDLAPVDPS